MGIQTPAISFRLPQSPPLCSSLSPNSALPPPKCIIHREKEPFRASNEHHQLALRAAHLSGAVCIASPCPFHPFIAVSHPRTCRIRASDEDFPTEDAIDESLESALDFLDNAADVVSVEERRLSLLSAGEGGDLATLNGGEAGKVVNYKIDEDEFHKIELYQCDFFIRKVPDKDDDVYDFQEMYVTPTDTDIYSHPMILGKMPTKPMRCSKSSWDSIYVAELPLGTPRAPYYKSEERAMKVFLMKHYKNRRADVDNYMLNFEQIYVIDAKTKSITRATVTVRVPEGKDRDRRNDALIVRNGGTSFEIIPKEKKKTPDQIIGAVHWKETRDNLQNFLRRFRDYGESNWF